MVSLHEDSLVSFGQVLRYLFLRVYHPTSFHYDAMHVNGNKFVVLTVMKNYISTATCLSKNNVLVILGNLQKTLPKIFIGTAFDQRNSSFENFSEDYSE